jgi:hypothetical protein
MPFDPSFGPPGVTRWWPGAYNTRPLSAVELGVTPFSAAHLGMFAWAPPVFYKDYAGESLNNNAPTASGPPALTSASRIPGTDFYRWSGDPAQGALPGAASDAGALFPYSGQPLPTSFAQSAQPANDPPPVTSSSLFGGSPDGSRAPASPRAPSCSGNGCRPRSPRAYRRRMIFHLSRQVAFLAAPLTAPGLRLRRRDPYCSRISRNLWMRTFTLAI